MTEKEIADIITNNVGLIHRALRSLVGSASYEDIEDMMQEVRIAMLRALRAYDESKGIPVKAYMMICMYHRVASMKMDYYRQRHVTLPGTSQKSEISVLSLDAPMQEGDQATFIETLADTQSDHTPEDEALARVATESALATLPARTAGILRLYARGYILRELSALYGGISKEWVRQIIERGLELITEKIENAS